MYYKRWFKVLVASVLLASVAFTVSPKVADVSVSAASICAAALRQGIGNVMPSQLSDRELCYRLQQIQGSTASMTVMTVSSPDASAIRSPGLAAPAAGMQAAPDYTFRVTTHVEGHGP
jgi:hypothetical protein